MHEDILAPVILDDETEASVAQSEGEGEVKRKGNKDQNTDSQKGRKAERETDRKT